MRLKEDALCSNRSAVKGLRSKVRVTAECFSPCLRGALLLLLHPSIDSFENQKLGS
jgi:hypothetical protein